MDLDIFKSPGSNLHGVDRARYDEIRGFIEKATSDRLSRADKTINMKCVDLVNKLEKNDIIHDVVFLLRKRITTKHTKATLLSLQLVATMVAKCSRQFLDALDNEKVNRDLAITARYYVHKGSSAPYQQVADLCLELIQTWGETLSSKRKDFPYLVDLYVSLRKEGLPFKTKFEPNPAFLPRCEKDSHDSPPNYHLALAAGGKEVHKKGHEEQRNHHHHHHRNNELKMQEEMMQKKKKQQEADDAAIAAAMQLTINQKGDLTPKIESQIIRRIFGSGFLDGEEDVHEEENRKSHHSHQSDHGHSQHSEQRQSKRTGPSDVVQQQQREQFDSIRRQTQRQGSDHSHSTAATTVENGSQGTAGVPNLPTAVELIQSLNVPIAILRDGFLAARSEREIINNDLFDEMVNEIEIIQKKIAVMMEKLLEKEPEAVERLLKANGDAAELTMNCKHVKSGRMSLRESKRLVQKSFGLAVQSSNNYTGVNSRGTNSAMSSRAGSRDYDHPRGEVTGTSYHRSIDIRDRSCSRDGSRNGADSSYRTRESHQSRGSRRASSRSTRRQPSYEDADHQYRSHHQHSSRDYYPVDPNDIVAGLEGVQHDARDVSKAQGDGIAYSAPTPGQSTKNDGLVYTYSENTEALLDIVRQEAANGISGSYDDYGRRIRNVDNHGAARFSPEKNRQYQVKAKKIVHQDSNVLVTTSFDDADETIEVLKSYSYECDEFGRPIPVDKEVRRGRARERAIDINEPRGSRSQQPSPYITPAGSRSPTRSPPPPHSTPRSPPPPHVSPRSPPRSPIPSPVPGSPVPRSPARSPARSPVMFREHGHEYHHHAKQYQYQPDPNHYSRPRPDQHYHPIPNHPGTGAYGQSHHYVVPPHPPTNHQHHGEPLHPTYLHAYQPQQYDRHPYQHHPYQPHQLPPQQYSNQQHPHNYAPYHENHKYNTQESAHYNPAQAAPISPKDDHTEISALTMDTRLQSMVIVHEEDPFTPEALDALFTGEPVKVAAPNQREQKFVGHDQGIVGNQTPFPPSAVATKQGGHGPTPHNNAPSVDHRHHVEVPTPSTVRTTPTSNNHKQPEHTRVTAAPVFEDPFCPEALDALFEGSTLKPRSVPNTPPAATVVSNSATQRGRKVIRPTYPAKAEKRQIPNPDDPFTDENLDKMLQYDPHADHQTYVSSTPSNFSTPQTPMIISPNPNEFISPEYYAYGGEVPGGGRGIPPSEHCAPIRRGSPAVAPQRR